MPFIDIPPLALESPVLGLRRFPGIRQKQEDGVFKMKTLLLDLKAPDRREHAALPAEMIREHSSKRGCIGNIDSLDGTPKKGDWRSGDKRVLRNRGLGFVFCRHLRHLLKKLWERSSC